MKHSSIAGRLDRFLRRTIDDFELPIFVILGVVLALLLRYSLLDFESGDYRAFVGHWYDFIRAEGFWRAFRYGFSNYTPLYLHFLALATLVPIPKLYAIKLVSVVFDFVAAACVYKIVRERYDDPLLPICASFALLFAPTVFLNGAFWGQCDIIYAGMILASLLCLIRKRYAVALILYGLSFSLKLQSLFVLPVYVLLWWRGEFSFARFFYVPVVYFLTIIPSLLVGRPLPDLLSIYLRQAEGNHLTMQAPNLYQWFPRADRYFRLLNPAGLALTAFIVLALFFIIHRGLKGQKMNEEILIQTSLLSALVMPYFLPQMHERYFFLADVLSIVYAFYCPKHFFVPIAVVMCSLFSYFPFLFRGTFIDLGYVALLLFVVVIFVMYDLIVKIYRTNNFARADL